MNEDVRKNARKWANGARRAIPTFIFLSKFNEKSLEDIYNTLHVELLAEVTEYFCEKPGGLTPAQFENLLKAAYKPHKRESFNQSISLYNLKEERENVWALLNSMSYNLEDKDEKRKKYKSAEVYTPLSCIDAMLDTIPADLWLKKESTFFDPACGRGVILLRIKERLMISLKDLIKDEAEREKHIVENMLFGQDIGILQTKIAVKVIDFNEQFKTNIIKGDTLMSKKGKSFDAIVTNPPFKSGMHIKFLVDALKHVKDDGTVCFVHPATWIVNEKPTRRPVNETKCLGVLNEYKTTLELFNGNKAFGVGLCVPCVITTIDKSKPFEKIKVKHQNENKEYIYDKAEDINTIGNIKEYFSLKEKMIDGSTSLLDKVGKGEGSYCVGLSQARGHISTNSDSMLNDDFYTLLPRAYEVESRKDSKKHLQFYFKTKLEANNFLAYLKTDFARFALSIYKMNLQLSTGELGAIPYLDFTKSWTDAKLKTHFKLTLKEIELIQQVIPRYY